MHYGSVKLDYSILVRQAAIPDAVVIGIIFNKVDASNDSVKSIRS
jgi:hypothetical protein